MNASCAPYRPLLSPALDGTLAPREHGALERHLASCADCRAARERLAAVVQLLRTTTLVPSSPDFVERLERRLDMPVRAEEEAARAPTLVVDAVSPRRKLAAIARGAGLVLCLGTATFLALVAITSPRAAPPSLEKKIDDVTPVQPPPPPQAPAPPPLIPPGPPVNTSPEPEKSFNTPDELKRTILDQFKDPAVEGSLGPSPTTEVAPLPPPVVAQVPLPPPPPSPTSTERPPPAIPQVVVRKVDEAALGRILALIFDDPSTEPARRVEMIAALVDFPHRRCYDALASVLGGSLDTRPQALACRAAAWETLGAFGNDDAIRTLLAVRAPDDTRLLLALARVKEESAVLLLAAAASNHPSVDTRIVIARALGRAGKRVAVPGLARALGEARQDALVRAEAALALGAIGDASALEPLKVAVSARSKLAEVRGAAARALGALALGPLGANAAKALVEPLEKDPHPVVREACALALGKSRQLDAALRPLVDRLDPRREKALRVRAAADSALVELTGLFRTADEWRRAVDVVKEKPALRAPGAIAVARSGFERLLASGQGTVVVLDRSGSMEQAGKMALARKTALDVVDALPASTERDPVGFSIVCFADAPAAFFARLVEPSPENREKARAGLERQRAWWARTDVLRALRSALSIEGVDSIVLMTDGLPTLGVSDPEQLLLELSRANASVGARIHVVALRDGTSPLALDSSATPPAGESPEISWMRRLALDNGGMFVKN